MARIGLRMMPPFPSSPLSSRKAGFPRYGWKAGSSDSAFPRLVQVKPSPGIPHSTRGLHLPFVHPVTPPYVQHCVWTAGSVAHHHSRGCSPLPQGPSLRTGLCCPGPSSLIWPHAPHSQVHPAFTVLPLIQDALAVRVRLGDPRVVPCFRCLLLLDMPPSTTPGSPSVAYAQFLHRRRWPSPSLDQLGTPKYPIIRFRWDGDFVASWFAICHLHSLRPVELLAPLADLTGYFSQPSGLLLPGFRRGSHPSRRRI